MKKEKMSAASTDCLVVAPLAHMVNTKTTEAENNPSAT